MTRHNPFRLDGKYAVVTGANRGLGLAFARGLASAGAHVGLLVRDGEGGASAREEITAAGGAADVFFADVTDQQQVRRVADDVAALSGGPDVLVCNAGAWIHAQRSFLLEVPTEIIEASQVDGAGLPRQLRSIVLPIISPGLAATALICFIFAWNEFFLAVNLTTTNAGTVPIFLVSFVAPEGQFWAHLSAAATIACLPVLLAGWAAQDKLVRGLSMGAVK